MKKVSFVIPVFNEGGQIIANLSSILCEIEKINNISFEVIVVDDGSTDDTFDKINTLASANNHIKLISFNRNFGKESAIQAGLESSIGEGVITLDSDLQHPPELIPKMIDLWLDGFDVVHACKTNRGKESASAKNSAKIFYMFFNIVAGLNIANHSDYKLLDRKVVDCFCNLPERNKFFRGLIPWLGFSSAKVYFEVPIRQSGKSRWSRTKLFAMALNAITIFSSLPLQLISLFGLFTMVISVIFGSIALYSKFSGSAVTGFTTVILLILFIGSVNMLGLGIIGLYIGQIYSEVKKRPTFVKDLKQTPPSNEN